MNRCFDRGNAERQSGRESSGSTGLWVSGVVLAEVFAATLLVVGVFDAAFQPLSWASAIQALLCASLGPVLWLTDRRLERLVQAPATELAGGSIRKAIIINESLS